MVACVHSGEGSMAIWPARPSTGGPQLNIVQRHTACNSSLRDNSLTPPDWKPIDEIRNPCSWHIGAQCAQDRAHHSRLLGNMSHREIVNACRHSCDGWSHPPPSLYILILFASGHEAVRRVREVSAHVAHAPIIARISIRPEESAEKIGIHNGFDIQYLFFSKNNFSTMLMLLSSTHLPYRFSISSFFKVLFSSQFSLCKKFHNVPLGHVYFFS
jgi:hypothetical protein